jgi:hypothetical protein
MELRSTEQETEELSRMYASLCQDENLKKVLPPLSSTTDINTDTSTVGGVEGNEPSTTETPVTATPVIIEELPQLLASQVLATLEALRERLAAQETVIERFRQRCGEKDAVTAKPRYGEKTLVRVQALLKLYDELRRGVNVAFGIKEEAEEEQSTSETSKQEAMVEHIRKQAQQEKEDNERDERAKQEELDRQEKERKAEEERRLEEQRQTEEVARLELERQQAESRRLAEEVREAERRVLEEARRADREWTNSISKGSDGVREQLRILVESTADDLAAQKTAISALHTLFSQIAAHPEETNFRRIRRDHPRFNKDIGCHAGGKELLIAAGFVLGAIDDVPCYISKEPNLEKDMDGWSAWFDLLKAALNIVEEELIK